MSTPTGEGRTEWRTNPRSLLVYNFDINGDTLKFAHTTDLRSDIVPLLRGGGSVSVVGLASRTGSIRHNDTLSQRRAWKTLIFLRHEVPKGFLARQVTGYGERAAARERYQDGTEDASGRFRSVVIFVARASLPPPNVPPLIDLTPELPMPPFPEEGVLHTLLEILEILHDVTFAVDVFGIVISGLLGEILTFVGLVAGVLFPNLMLVYGWDQEDDLATLNGACKGVWNAIQDMADAFSDRSLDAIPESRWPPVPHPRPHLDAVSESTLQLQDRVARQGEREGCQQAYDAIMRAERVPIVHRQVIRGRPKTIRLTGRMFLRVLSYASHVHRQEVADVVRAEFNRRLRARGFSDWPVTRMP